MELYLEEYRSFPSQDSALSSEISAGQKVRLETWWDNAPAEGAAPEVECYFWCREDDSLVPKPPPDADSTQKELELGES